MGRSTWCLLKGVTILLALVRCSNTSFGSLRCPCVGNLAQWDFTLEQAMHVSDVVMMGKVVDVQEGLRGTMNATIAAMYTYKGSVRFLTQVKHVTNFDRGVDRDRMALFFLVTEPAGNLALQCMSPLPSLNGDGGNTLMDILDFVYELGDKTNKENEHFVPPYPNPCTSMAPHPCDPQGRSFCSVKNTLPGENYKCVCLTGYVGDGHICTVFDETPPTAPPTPPGGPPCGGLSSPLLDEQGRVQPCQSTGDLLTCPPLHYCHHSVCCPVTPPNTDSIHIEIAPPSTSSPSPPPTFTILPTRTPTPLTPSPSPTPSTDADVGSGCGSGDGDCVERGSGSGDCVGSGCGSGDCVGERCGSGSGDCVGSGCESGSGSGSGDCVGEGCDNVAQPEIEWENPFIDTFLDDEDMAYGQRRRRRRRKRR